MALADCPSEVPFADCPAAKIVSADADPNKVDAVAETSMTKKHGLQVVSRFVHVVPDWLPEL